MTATIRATLLSDPACPWAYSASPALRVIEWRYREQIDWRLVLIGLSESPDRYLEHGYTPAKMAQGHLRFRDRYGMPFSAEAKRQASGSSRACRAVVAARLEAPGSEWKVFRELQLANFNTELVFDDDAQLAVALDQVDGIDGALIVAAIDNPEVVAAYEADKAAARTAAGTPAALQGKTANSGGLERFTAPSVIFERVGGGIEGGPDRLIVGGFQPVEAYDLAVANLDPTLRRAAPASDPEQALAYFPLGLTTQEVAAVMTADLEPVDRTGAERELLALVAGGGGRRRGLGSDALWTGTLSD